MIERLVTAVPAWHGRLRATIRRVGWTLQADMNVVGVAVPGTQLGHPRCIVRAFDAAELFFYRCIDQDPLDFGLLGGGSDESNIGGTPSFVIDVLAIRGNHLAG